MFERFAKLFSFIWGSHVEFDPRSSGSMWYDLVINYVDEDREPNTNAFRFARDRDRALREIMDGAAEIASDEEGAIASLVFEDRFTFWQRSQATPIVPTTFPVLEGAGEQVLRIGTTGNGVMETIGYNMHTVLQVLSKVENAMVPVDASLILRRTAYERKWVLVRTDLSKVG